MAQSKPSLYTVLSPALLHLYDVKDTIVVVIDVLRATSTIAAAIFNGAKSVIPVDSVAEKSNTPTSKSVIIKLKKII